MPVDDTCAGRELVEASGPDSNFDRAIVMVLSPVAPLRRQHHILVLATERGATVRMAISSHLKRGADP